jgi:hypothetical protein
LRSVETVAGAAAAIPADSARTPTANAARFNENMIDSQEPV